MDSSLKFISIGYGYILCANKVWSIMRLRSRQSERMLAMAKRTNMYYDYTAGRRTRTLITLDSGCLVGCAITVSTVYKRLNETNISEKDISIPKIDDPDSYLDDEEPGVIPETDDEEEAEEVPKKKRRKKNSYLTLEDDEKTDRELAKEDE